MQHESIEGKNLVIPAPLIEATLQYFWTRPMGEVYDLFNQWQVALKTAVPPSSEPEKPAAKPAFPTQAPTGQALHRDEIAAA